MSTEPGTAITPDVPWLDLADPGFDTNGEQVHAARERSWWARTPYGAAVLRHQQGAALLRDRRFVQGNARWPEQNGIHSGLFHDWWAETLLSLEGEDHHRVRRLLLPAFRKRSIEAMRPSFTALAEELVDGFAGRGRVELVSELAEPYAARVICRLLGLDEDHWPQVAHWADDLGASFSTDVAAQVPRIEAALDGLSGYLADVVADRRAAPRDDFLTALVGAADAPPDGEAGLSDHELSVALVFLVFAGMETTRNQLTLAVRTLLRHPDQWRLLAGRPDLGAACVEEVMRVDPTVTWVTREALEEVDLGDGLVVPAGGVVQVLSHAAGTDPAAAAGGGTGLDLEAAARGERVLHTGFGAGIHHCLGHYVARVDMAVVLPLLTARMPDAECDGPGEWLPASGNTGAVSFPLRFTPT